MKCLTLPESKLAFLQKVLATCTALMCCGGPAALAQNVIRGTAPGWPGNTAYYAPQTVYQYAPPQPAPVVQAQYAPQPAVTAYYAPASSARIAYAVPAAGSYQISYAGANQPGATTTAYYGGYSAPVQRIAYMPQQVYYAPQQAVAPVTYYRPVIAYQPAPGAVAVAPQTCGYAATCQTSSCTSSCGSSSCWSPWRPFAWLWGNNNSCCKPQTCNYGGCGAPAAAPYYVAPVAPVIPTAPAPAVGTPFRSTIIGPGTTIPSPGTRSGPAGTIINTEPANIRPALPPGTITSPPVNPGFGGGLAPGGVPGGVPGTGGEVPFDQRFRPQLTDPYSQPAPAIGVPSSSAPQPPMIAPPAASNQQFGSQVIGSGYRNERANLVPENQPNAISEPGFISPPSSVQPLRDPHGDERNQQNNNRAPQLITPGDRTASANQRWAVTPAVWPVQPGGSQPAAATSETLVPVVAPAQLDDSGWKSAR